MIVENILFWVFGLLAVTAGLGVVFHRSLIYSALFLIVVFLSIAGVFVLNNADFLAVAQTIVYGVGLTIIILFGIMFTGDRPFEDRFPSPSKRLAYLIVGGLFLAMLIPATIYQYNIQPASKGLIATYMTEGSTGLLGLALFTKYALPFEVASVLLLLAMVGAIILSKKHMGSVEESEEASVKYALSTTTLKSEAEQAYERAPFHGQAKQENEKEVKEEEQESETVGA